jgi:two-component system, NarL family, sensor histidine kinase UhpB
MSIVAERAKGLARNNGYVSTAHPSPATGASTRATGPAGSRARARGYLPLFGRILIANAVLLVTSLAVVFLTLFPRRVSQLDTDLILIAALAVITVSNVVMLRRIAVPFQQLTAFARRVDPAKPGERMPGAGARSEAGELAVAFNEMLDRLELERAASTRRVLAAHEAERLRIAQELHDEVGQTLTAVLLQLSRLRDHVRAETRPELEEAVEAARASLDDVRRIATELRPEALRDLGLPSALAALSETFGKRTGITVRRRIDAELPPLGDEAELAVYRVAQEALTNIARHSGSTTADLTLVDGASRLRLSVRDYGRGIVEDRRSDGAGIRGMRERAQLIGAKLTVGRPASGPGSEVTLDLPPVAAR